MEQISGEGLAQRFSRTMAPPKGGLPNLGNTCFLNAGAQALAATRLWDAVLRWNAPKPTQGFSGWRFFQRFARCFAAGSSNEAARALVEELAEVRPPLRHGHQHDASEVLLRVLEITQSQCPTQLRLGNRLYDTGWVIDSIIQSSA